MTMRLAAAGGESLDTLKNDGMPERMCTRDQERGNKENNYEYHSFRRYTRIRQPFTHPKTLSHSADIRSTDPCHFCDPFYERSRCETACRRAGNHSSRLWRSFFSSTSSVS